MFWFASFFFRYLLLFQTSRHLNPSHAHVFIHSEMLDVSPLECVTNCFSSHNIARGLHKAELLQLQDEQEGRSREPQVCQPHLGLQDDCGRNTPKSHSKHLQDMKVTGNSKCNVTLPRTNLWWEDWLSREEQCMLFTLTLGRHST